MACLLPGDCGEDEVAWLWVHVATPRPAQLSLLDLFSSLIFYSLLVSDVISSCIICDLLCRCGGFLGGFCPHSNQGSGKEGAGHSTNCKTMMQNRNFGLIILTCFECTRLGGQKGSHLCS